MTLAVLDKQFSVYILDIFIYRSSVAHNSVIGDSVVTVYMKIFISPKFSSKSIFDYSLNPPLSSHTMKTPQFKFPLPYGKVDRKAQLLGC